MKQATFSDGVIFALISSVSSAVIFIIVSELLFGETFFRLLIAGLAFIYILYLFSRGEERFGRLAVMVTWCVVTLATLIFIPSLVFYLFIQVFMIWLVRALYFYNSILTALIDFALTGLSMIIAIWSWSVSHSMLLTIWSFFLVQALFVYIPKKISGKKNNQAGDVCATGKFEHAYKAAEVAVRKLTSAH